MTADTGEIFRDLIAEYEAAQRAKESVESPTPHFLGQFWMNKNMLHISALGPDGKTLTWIPLETPKEQDDGSAGVWV